MYIYIPCTCTLLFIYWGIFSVYSCTVIFCRDLVYIEHIEGWGDGKRIQVDEMKKRGNASGKNHDHTSLLSFIQMKSKCLFSLIIFFFFSFFFCLCLKFSSSINIWTNHGLFSELGSPPQNQRNDTRANFKDASAELCLDDVGTLLVLTLKGILWHLQFKLKPSWPLVASWIVRNSNSANMLGEKSNTVKCQSLPLK